MIKACIVSAIYESCAGMATEVIFTGLYRVGYWLLVIGYCLVYCAVLCQLYKAESAVQSHCNLHSQWCRPIELCEISGTEQSQLYRGAEMCTASCPFLLQCAKLAVHSYCVVHRQLYTFSCTELIVHCQLCTATALCSCASLCLAKWGPERTVHEAGMLSRCLLWWCASCLGQDGGVVHYATSGTDLLCILCMPCLPVQSL